MFFLYRLGCWAACPGSLTKLNQPLLLFPWRWGEYGTEGLVTCQGHRVSKFMVCTKGHHGPNLPNLVSYLLLQIKFYWNTDMHVWLPIYDCLHRIMAELRSCPYGLRWLKYFLYRKNLASSFINHCRITPPWWQIGISCTPNSKIQMEYELQKDTENGIMLWYLSWPQW